MMTSAFPKSAPRMIVVKTSPLSTRNIVCQVSGAAGGSVEWNS